MSYGLAWLGKKGDLYSLLSVLYPAAYCGLAKEDVEVFF